MKLPGALSFVYGVAFLLYLGLVLVFTYVLEWGFIGVCWATSLNYIFRFCLGLVYMSFKESEALTVARNGVLFQR